MFPSIAEILASRFVDFTDHAAQLGATHRVFLSAGLHEHCQCSTDNRPGRDLANEIVEAVVTQINKRAVFPAVLWRHPWRPLVLNLPSESGRLHLFVTLVNETTLGTELMISLCKHVCGFAELEPWDKGNKLLRIFLGRQLSETVSAIPHPVEAKGPKLLVFLLYLTADCVSELAPFGGASINGVNVYWFYTKDDSRTRSFYFMLGSESPVRRPFGSPSPHPSTQNRHPR